MTQPMTQLLRRLEQLDGKSYSSYKSVKGRYQYPDFELVIDHVQGDPFAQPSKVRVFLPFEVAGFPVELRQGRSRQVALRDQMTRLFCQVAATHSRVIGSGKGGLLVMDKPGQQVLARSSVLLQDDGIEARFLVGLPANGRRIMGHAAAEIFAEKVPDIVQRSLFYQSHDAEYLRLACLTNEDADVLRKQLHGAGLVAFVADGSLLPRASGIDDRPLRESAEPFHSPASFRVSLSCPNRGEISGLGIKEGVNLIVGGGYHGKSTLLRAIQNGVYNHIPGDGREAVVTDPSATKIRSEDGRAISGVRISPFIANLPQNKNTETFSSENASGSTSQAAAIVEAMEAGCRLLLLDEDTSATNFMIRDRRMQELIAKSHEPITPFADRVRQLYHEHGISTLLVMGGSGDYFDLADHVIAMDHYQPKDVTEQAHAIAKAHATGRQAEGGGAFGRLKLRQVATSCFDPRKGRRDIHIRTRSKDNITVGSEEIDLIYVEQLVHNSQLRAIAWALVQLAKTQANVSLAALVHQKWDLATLSDSPDGDLAEFRGAELLACINRLRRLKIGATETRAES